jgi:hypothetical protein
MGGAVSGAMAPSLADERQLEIWEDILPSVTEALPPSFAVPTAAADKLQFLRNFESAAKTAGMADERVSEVAQDYRAKARDLVAQDEAVRMAGASQMMRDNKKNGKAGLVVVEVTSSGSVGCPQTAKTTEVPGGKGSLRFKPGDEIRYTAGDVAFTVEHPLGCGAFGEVHVVRSPDGRQDAMKCTKLADMTQEQRERMFLPLCEEALLMVKLGHHPNLIALQFVMIKGEEFLVIMDLVEGSMELEKAYKDDSLWLEIDGGRNAWTAPPTAKISAVLAMLWYVPSFLDTLPSFLL